MVQTMPDPFKCPVLHDVTETALFASFDTSQHPLHLSIPILDGLRVELGSFQPGEEALTAL